MSHRDFSGHSRGENTIQSIPKHKLLWMEEEGDGPVPLAAGCGGSQQVVLMNQKSTALPLGCSAVKAKLQEKKRSSFCRVFLQLITAACLHVLTAHKATRIWHLLNSVIKKKKVELMLSR